MAFEDTALGKRLFGKHGGRKWGVPFYVFKYIFHKRKLQFFEAFFISTFFPGSFPALVDYRKFAKFSTRILNLVWQYGLRVQKNKFKQFTERREVQICHILTALHVFWDSNLVPSALKLRILPLHQLGISLRWWGPECIFKSCY